MKFQGGPKYRVFYNVKKIGILKEIGCKIIDALYVKNAYDFLEPEEILPHIEHNIFSHYFFLVVSEESKRVQNKKNTDYEL